MDSAGRFYREVIGLAQIAQDGQTLHLGVDGRVLITLRHDPEAASDSTRSAGLYHVAFLLPSRDYLSVGATVAQWVARSRGIALSERVRLDLPGFCPSPSRFRPWSRPSRT